MMLSYSCLSIPTRAASAEASPALLTETEAATRPRPLVFNCHGHFGWTTKRRRTIGSCKKAPSAASPEESLSFLDQARHLWPGNVSARTRLSVHVLKVKSGNTSCAGRLQSMNSDEPVGRLWSL